MKFWYYCLTAAVFLISASFSLPHHHPLFSVPDVSGPVGYNENTSSTFHKPDYVFREPKEPYFEKIFACQTNCLRADNLGGFVFDDENRSGVERLRHAARDVAAALRNSLQVVRNLVHCIRANIRGPVCSIKQNLHGDEPGKDELVLSKNVTEALGEPYRMTYSKLGHVPSSNIAKEVPQKWTSR
ncbi:unnamed protein product [Acanthoscelides obtectus]|uniref:Uncharacterized protein n=1 Tax=Acanthoscelides obtectus TaxID=200917 RepID=A0A9P0JN99_ACAOB|nr:unnamed protein product [Acanthoscelides obtectus]CAK1639948.1 hypothetical protein AOBTE_LOCUS11470 [Acanthoscelides obtectus]